MSKKAEFHAYVGRLEEHNGILEAFRLCDDFCCGSFPEARKEAKQLFQGHSVDEKVVAYVLCDKFEPFVAAGIKREAIANFGNGYRVDVTPERAKPAPAPTG
jgi:hypothetical protein